MKNKLSILNSTIIRGLEETTIINKKKQMESPRAAVLEALRQSEERHRAIIENIEEGYFEVDLAGKFTFFNNSMCMLLGYSKEEMMGMNSRQFTDKETSEEVLQTFNRVYRTGKPDKGFEWQIIRKDGAKRCIEASISLLKDSSDKPNGFRSIVRDITKRRQVESQREATLEALKKSEENYLQLFENFPAAMYRVDFKSGKILKANDLFCEYVGCSQEEITSISPYDLLTEDSKKLLLDRMEKMALGIEVPETVEYEGFDKKGKRWCLKLHNINIYDAEGHVVASDVVAHDITERKRVEENYRFSEEKFYKIFMTTPNCITITRLQDGLFIDVNKAYEDIVGWKRENVIGTTSTDPRHIFWVDLSDRELMVTELKAGRDILTRQFKFRRSDGSVRDGIYSARPINVNEEECLIFILQDITDHLRMDVELRRTLKSLSKAFSTTINVMISAVEMRDPYTAGHQKKAADFARVVAMEMGLDQEKIDGIRMAGIIHDIGKLSIPSEILTKPTKLTEIEYSLIQEHSRSGYEMLRDVESPWPLAEIVYQHHERMDGSGYPRNLKGDEILIEARILAVSDVVVSMASHRPYRAALGIEAALEEVEKNKGILYDDDVADACLRLFRVKGYQLS